MPPLNTVATEVNIRSEWLYVHTYVHTYIRDFLEARQFALSSSSFPDGSDKPDRTSWQRLW